MKGYFFLTFNKDNSVIILGERLGKNEIVFKGKPSFFDAIRFTDSSPPEDVNFHFQLFLSSPIPNETFNFHDPVLYQKIKLMIGHRSLIIIDNENNLTSETVFNIFSYFLIKKGNKMLFLTDIPNNKIPKKRKRKFLPQKDEQEQKNEGENSEI